MLETGRTKAPGPGQVPTVTLQDDAQPGDPGLGAERLRGGLEHRGPDTVEQITDLLHLPHRLGDQLLATGAEVP